MKTYEDYLTALGQLNTAYGVPEVDYYTYMQLYAKQSHERGGNGGNSGNSHSVRSKR